MNETTPLPARLVTCVDIAASRVKDMPSGTLAANIARAARYQHELRNAKEELERGEWRPE